MGSPSAPDMRPQAEAQRYAADLENKASLKAILESKRQYNQTRKDFAPWRDIGLQALSQINERLGLAAGDQGAFQNAAWKPYQAEDLYNDPGYQFRLREGERGTRRSLNALGHSYGGGATQKALARYNQGFATQEYGTARQRAVQDYTLQQSQRTSEYNRLAGLSGTGQVATQQLAGLGASAVNQQNQYRVQGAQALGAGAVGAETSLVQGQIYQNQASQQRFNNILGIVSIGLGSYSALYPKGVQG